MKKHLNISIKKLLVLLATYSLFMDSLVLFKLKELDVISIWVVLGVFMLSIFTLILKDERNVVAKLSIIFSTILIILLGLLVLNTQGLDEDCLVYVSRTLGTFQVLVILSYVTISLNYRRIKQLKQN